jgi:hypothetical protein
VKFSLEDLNPRSCDIEVELGGEVKTFRLRKFNLMTQLWVRKEWGSEAAFNQALDPTSEINVKTSSGAYIEALCKTLHHLLEDKEQFPTWEDFATSIGSGPSEILNLGKALMVVIGLSQPIVDKVTTDSKKKMKNTLAKAQAGT